MYFDLEVSKVENGYVVSFWEFEDKTSKETQYAFEVDDEDEHGEIECFKRLLLYITNHFSMTGTKHDKRRIRITTGGEDE
jgi:hypothetical protein